VHDGFRAGKERETGKRERVEIPSGRRNRKGLGEKARKRVG